MLAMKLRFFAACLLLAACAEPPGPDLFSPGVRVDTLLVVGEVSESRDLLVYGTPLAQLLDDTTIVYADNSDPGRVVVVNPFTADGWQVAGRAGAEGPGEFGRDLPFLSSVRGRIQGFTMSGAFNAWTPEGDLTQSSHVEHTWFSDGMFERPVGIVGGRLVTSYTEIRTSGVEEQSVRQGLRIYSFDGELLADTEDDVPPLVTRGVTLDDGRVARKAVSGGGFMAAARGNTIVWMMHDQGRLTTLDSAGAVIARGEVEYPLFDVLIDADGRIWAKTRVRDEDGTLGNIVLDRNLNELFRVSALHVQDAADSTVLAFQRGASQEVKMVLLGMRGLPEAPR